MNRLLVQELLEAFGAQVPLAADGQQALAEIDRQQPDLILLDAMMPAPDGFEVCRRIKNNAALRLTPVIMVTALSERADRIRGIEAGADDFITKFKPFDRHELLARSVEAKDPYTEGHCERLSAYSVALGRRLRLPEADLEALYRGGILHDLGEVGVPDAILLKPGPLTPEERQVMELHAVRGYEICKPLRSFRNVLPIIRHHHERWNGSGYPDRLRREEIPRLARILQVVDIYDALTTDRPYRRAKTQNEALVIMEQEAAKGWWDPTLVKVFADMVCTGAFMPN